LIGISKRGKYSTFTSPPHLKKKFFFSEKEKTENVQMDEKRTKIRVRWKFMQKIELKLNLSQAFQNLITDHSDARPN
jgi:hypothetical protein